MEHTRAAPKGDEGFAELLSEVPPKMERGDFQKTFDARAAWSSKHEQKIGDVLKRYVAIATKSTGAAKLTAVGRVVQLKYHLALLAKASELPESANTEELVNL